jgi:hypothetical protein
MRLLEAISPMNPWYFPAQSLLLRWRSRKLTHLYSFKWTLSLETIFPLQAGV